MIVVSAAKLAFGAVMAIAITMSGPAVAEEGTVEAFSSWEARGQTYPTGPTEKTFVGVLSGVLYVTDETGSMDTGLITCPVTVAINTEDGSQVADGKCVIVTSDSERVYAEFKCSGDYLEGCNGDFTLKGGTGDKENISGGGPIQIKTAFAKIAAVPGSVVEEVAVGLAVWPELTYKLP